MPAHYGPTHLLWGAYSAVDVHRLRRVMSDFERWPRLDAVPFGEDVVLRFIDPDQPELEPKLQAARIGLGAELRAINVLMRLQR